MLKTILAFRSVANHFLGVFQRGDLPESPPQILGKPKNHFVKIFFGHPLYPSKQPNLVQNGDLSCVFSEQVKFRRFQQYFCL